MITVQCGAVHGNPWKQDNKAFRIVLKFDQLPSPTACQVSESRNDNLHTSLDVCTAVDVGIDRIYAFCDHTLWLQQF